MDDPAMDEETAPKDINLHDEAPSVTPDSFLHSLVFSHFLSYQSSNCQCHGRSSINRLSKKQRKMVNKGGSSSQMLSPREQQLLVPTTTY